jgi:hypothetical protein
MKHWYVSFRRVCGQCGQCDGLEHDVRVDWRLVSNSPPVVSTSHAHFATRTADTIRSFRTAYDYVYDYDYDYRNRNRPQTRHDTENLFPHRHQGTPPDGVKFKMAVPIHTAHTVAFFTLHSTAYCMYMLYRRNSMQVEPLFSALKIYQNDHWSHYMQFLSLTYWKVRSMKYLSFNLISNAEDRLFDNHFWLTKISRNPRRNETKVPSTISRRMT